uniref:FkbM family methyltransferase n=1 Tax=uncultured Nitratireductor sp. TaxID=520953 RepID=UPI0025F7D81D
LQFATSGLFSRVVSVEPMPENFAILSHNIHLNCLGGVLAAVNCAASDKAGRAVMQADAVNSGAHTLRAMADTPSGRSVEVDVLPVGAILAKSGVPVGDVGCVWIDAEGFEPEIVRSALDAGVREAMFHVEFTPRFYGPEKTAEFIAFLRARFDRVHFLTGRGIEPATFDELDKVATQQDIVVSN